MAYIILEKLMCPFCNVQIIMGKIRKPSRFVPTIVKATCKGVVHEGCLCDITFKIHYEALHKNRIEIINIFYSEKSKLILADREKLKKSPKKMADRMGGAY